MRRYGKRRQRESERERERESEKEKERERREQRLSMMDKVGEAFDRRSA